MSRSVILSNGQLAVGLNDYGLVHDFYYPYVGLDNLTTARSMHHKLGIWVDDTFSWVDDGSWKIDPNFESDALISHIRMTNKKLSLSLLLTDFVDSEKNAFIRKVTVKNLAKSDREVRIFFHQVFQISNEGTSDTALYEPDEQYILDYKGRCSLLIYAESNGEACDQFAVGNYGIEGKQGTYVDAEDGELSGCAVEHGGVDSCLRLSLNISAKSEADVDYWIVAADSQFHAEKNHLGIKESGTTQQLTQTRQYWNKWVSTAQPTLDKLDDKYQGACSKSLLLIKAHIDKRGGIIASADSSIYNYGRDYYAYVWPRDGAFAIWPLIILGYTEEPKKFFTFCRDILTDDGYLMHKYQPDKAIGSTWHPLVHGQHSELGIQEDETAIILFMLGEYLRFSGDLDFIKEMYSSLIEPIANFMSTFIDEQTSLPHASYDLWEQKFLTTTYTTSITYRALKVAAQFADSLGHSDHSQRWEEAAAQILENVEGLYDGDAKSFVKGYLLQGGEKHYDTTLDVSSLYGAMTFGLFKEQDTDAIYATASKIEETLLDISPSGGVARYENDTYFQSKPEYKGNPWIVTTLWMAQYYLRTHQVDKAEHYINWALEKQLPSGVMSEQINPTTSEPTSVTPLVWSHAELLNTVLMHHKLKE